MSIRNRLHNRRPSVTHRLDTEHGRAYVTLGYDIGTCRPYEVFISGPKAGSSLQALLDDAGVLLSLALQYQVPIKQLTHSLDHGREEGAKSILGEVARLLEERV